MVNLLYCQRRTMIKLKHLVPFFLLAVQPLLAQVVAQSPDVQFDDKKDPDSQDMDALRRWLRDKRMVTIKEIGGDLSLSGEVRTEFQAQNEKRNGVQQRGTPVGAAGVIKPMYAWDVEVNVMIDYRTDRTWAAIKLEFDNDMGIRSGTVNKIKLEKAYLGGRFIPGDTFTLDGEIGRRNLYNVFDSKVEFASLFDGLLFRFSKAFDSIGEMYCNLAAFLINDQTNHYGLVTEIGALGVANTGLNLKYSLIDWYRPGSETGHGTTNVENQLAMLRFRFLVSQFLMSYQFYPEWIGKKLIKFYAAGLMNHIALNNPLQHAHVPNAQAFGRQNLGCYAGVSIGLVKKQGDWAVDANYQWVQAQVIPSFDLLGIGRGNAAGAGLYTANDDGSGGAT
ncbi:MAG: hypothetical protein RL235_434, partial [Chlamydiota bacterium]